MVRAYAAGAARNSMQIVAPVARPLVQLKDSAARAARRSGMPLGCWMGDRRPTRCRVIWLILSVGRVMAKGN